MPRVIDLADDTVASLAEVGDALAAAPFDANDPDSVMHTARWLRRLGNDSDFLGDVLVAQLAERHRAVDAGGGYGPQVIMLRPPDGRSFIRANIWPSAQDHAMRASGGASFVYDMPHDHNFSFLTLGYFGPGYWSDYYEYDHAAVAGWTGEPVPSLRFVERSRLEPGKLMLYRAHRDVHAQHPADALSISLNIMQINAAQNWSNQYGFDLQARKITAILSPGPSEAFLRIAVALGTEEALDLAERFAHHHPSERMRLCAWDALAGAATDQGARDALWQQAEQARSRLVAMEARARRVALADQVN